ncbi:hypothetical protein VMCG_10747 [Cytospora schulzeri]|uniref:Carboxypeptidase n=1 Tax=Cytospora schulzeri TaxID=448051 RepID=A0A423V955_9PEZI|nr:hypothetical protein VMCG_10747 [Valsa malicola]
MRLSAAVLCLGLASLPAAIAASWHKPKSVPPRATASNARILKRETAGITYSVYEHAATNSTMEFVEDSGICETTPGVKTYSGYLSVGANMSMWFWFFEARNNASTAPLALWLNGGPGCSSMIGLFQENGPCRFVNGSDEPSLNPYSWNEYANMLYVDQPINTGFSFGDDEATSTVTAAPFVWAFLQAFLAAFPVYESRDFGLWTESYGGHYGPEFAEYFETQNKAITNGTITGEPIDIVALGINNGWIDPVIQYQAYVDFGHNNSWRQLINDTQYTELQRAYETKCLPLLERCPGETGTDKACYNADSSCYDYVEGVVENGPPDYPDFDAYDIREPSNDAYPPETYVDYLRRPDVMTAIGAKVTYEECPNEPYYKIADTGDDARSFLDALSAVVQSGISTLIWAGDADWICNYLGVERSVNKVNYTGTTEFQTAALEEYVLNGTSYGQYKTVGNLNYLKVHAAGHEVAYYQPEMSLQVFKQIMQKQPLSSTA